jgi:hypothetical protein
MHSRHILALLVASVAAAPIGRAGNSNVDDHITKFLFAYILTRVVEP